MKKAFFITATDTNAGKTFVASALAKAARQRGMDVGVMKPVETGCPLKNGKPLPLDAVRLKEAARSSDPLDLINPYRFPLLLAPSIAARISGKRIDFRRIKKAFETLSAGHDVMFVEGAGGLATPLAGDKTTLDLILFLGIPAIIVSPSRLGCINSTLLTLVYAMNSGVEVKGVILNHPTAKTDLSDGFNCKELERFGVPVIGALPFSEKGERGLRIKKAAGEMLFKPRRGLLCS
ncbi:MAG: dethiobiotin synthase [Deltaproteobacteria bacterium]|nr:dethiobiotin synthase [Deltaproteobacteria bacterium]